MQVGRDETTQPHREFLWEIGVDTGGTFTDCVARSTDGRMARAKVLSTSALRVRVESIGGCTVTVRQRIDLDDSVLSEFFLGFELREISQGSSGSPRPVQTPSVKILAAHRLNSCCIEFTLHQPLVVQSPSLERDECFLDIVAPFNAAIFATRLAIGRPHPLSLADCRLCVGTTKGTNSLLEGTTTPVTFFVNDGLEDILAIGDQRRIDIFASAPKKPRRIERSSIGVPARQSASGAEITPLDEALLRRRARDAFTRGDRTAAVALLHEDPSRPTGVMHEHRVAEVLREEGFEWVSCSHTCVASSRFEPRARACVVDAALSGPVGEFIASTQAFACGAEILMMSSAGGLVSAATFAPRESLLSGPAGGVAGAATVAAECGLQKCVTLDMGGTSADVARIDGLAEMRAETILGHVTLASPCVAVESVAAGGGSILWFDGEALRVGPRSAGSYPGPACYGAGGPLTLTDANVLLHRIDASMLSIPISESAAEERARELHRQVSQSKREPMTLTQMLETFIAIADESMAAAIRTVTIRRGIDPSDHALIAFGGAGALHACAVAERLGMQTVVYPAEAGLLCARGICDAAITQVASAVILCDLAACGLSLGNRFDQLGAHARQQITAGGGDGPRAHIRRRSALLRFQGHDESMEVTLADGVSDPELAAALDRGFREKFRVCYGFDAAADRPIEVERIWLQLEVSRSGQTRDTAGHGLARPARAAAENEDAVIGPRVITRRDSTAFIPQGWQSRQHPSGALIFTRAHAAQTPSVAYSHELIATQLVSIATDMGEQLRRTATSPNIKDRLDFSCGLLDAAGFLVVNAPHIPIHLGALGACVRAVTAVHAWRQGDVLVVNHPRFGGSHLPDLTAITPIFTDAGELFAFAANRAHHAEVGGTRPGSMPPDATSLAQEGVVIEPTLIVESGRECFESVAAQLRSGPWPSRLVGDNLADLRAQVAANALGVIRLRVLVAEGSLEQFRASCEKLRASARRAAESMILVLPLAIAPMHEKLDDGTVLCVRMARDPSQPRLTIDFTSTSPTHARNLNAPVAVTHAAVMYSLRVLVGRSLGVDGPAFALNEGLLDPIDVILPAGTILSPDFSGTPQDSPACAIGQTETAQRLVDLLWRAFDLAACSQGTINNLLFGNQRFGFYETIAGGAGATAEGPGASGVHTHISNTRITDAEVLERRYPVRLERFSLRPNSGGAGAHAGGDGLLRRIRFLERVELSFLSQHRIEAPYGAHGGEPGKCGAQRIIRASGAIEVVGGIVAARMEVGDQFEVETPGGGGYGVR